MNYYALYLSVIQFYTPQMSYCIYSAKFSRGLIFTDFVLAILHENKVHENSCYTVFGRIAKLLLHKTHPQRRPLASKHLARNPRVSNQMAMQYKN